jgi:hypothetical protein
MTNSATFLFAGREVLETSNCKDSLGVEASDIGGWVILSFTGGAFEATWLGVTPLLIKSI